jgi:hypothetical protein
MTTRDFTKDRSAGHTFTVGENTYTAVAGLPAQSMLDFAGQFGGLTPATPVDEQLKVFSEILGALLEDDSYTVFREAMATKHPVNMIEFDQMEQIITWLLEEFGMRPTQPFSPSVTGPVSPDGGTNWTGSTPAVELI